MLWHLMLPRLGAPSARDALLLLEAALRPSDPATDAERLLPALIGAFGEDHARQFLQRELAKARDPEQQRRLRELAGRS